MDLHRLRVVEFDTSVREKEREKKHIAELEKFKKEEKKTSAVGNKDGIGYEKKCLGEEISPPGTSNKHLGDTSSQPGAIKICVNDDRTPPRISKQCSDDKLRLPGTSKKYINDTTFTSHLGTSKNQRSKSEIFKIPSKKKPRKRSLKINSSDLGLTKLFQDSAYPHQKKRTLNLRDRSRNARIHHKQENVKEKKEKSEEIHFLFAREKPSYLRYRRKRTDHERTKKKRDSKFPNDIYGFQPSNRSLAQYQYQMSHFNFIDTDKLSFKKLREGFHRKSKPPQPVTNCFCKHHAMRVLNSACGNGDSRPIHYNLSTHPHPRRYQQKHLSNQEEGVRRERSHYMAKDEIVEVSLSSFSPATKSLRDARTGPSKVELTADSHHRPLSLLEKSTTLQNFTVASEYNQKSCPLPSNPSPCAACAAPADRTPCELKKSQTFQDVTSVGNQKPCPQPSTPSPCALCAARAAPAQNKCKKKRKKTKKPFLVLTLCNGLLSRLVELVTNFHVRNNMSGKSCLKYVIFGLLIVVWSPCLLAVILAWVIMFPWKLTNILKADVTAKRSFSINHSLRRLRKNNLRREYQQMCFENYLPEKKRSFLTSAASWYSRTVGVVANSFNAVVSLLKLKKKAPTGAGTSFLPSSHPNPRKRYKLFYAHNRGWVMKPLRRRTRPSARNRVVQNMRCEFRPTFWQKIRCQNLQQTSLRKVPCPVHGTDSYPMHQSSPAGQSRNPCSSCISPNSHHHRQLQVNIPPTFHFTTSGIAPVSANRTVNTKPNMFNSIKITNNIAHEKLAKDHRWQRKNGTLPFGVVPKGLTKHDAGNTLIKAIGVHRITSLTDITNHMPSCGLNKLGRQTIKREISLNCPSARNSPTLQKKCVLTDIFQSVLTEKANTSTFKVNYTYKTQDTSQHIPYQKVTNKPKTVKLKAVRALNCAREAELFSPKQAYKYKTDKSRAPAQKHPSPAKIKSSLKHDIIMNYSFGNKRKKSKHSYKYKPDLVPATTQMLSNTADITTTTNRDVALNGPCGREHEKFKYGYEHKPHQISAATQKQLCTADITTSTNRNIALNCPREANPGLSKHDDKHKLHQIPIATQMQSRTADNATSTKHNVALNFPCEEKYKLSKHGYKHKSHQIPVATQMQLKTADITTSTNRHVATDCPCEEKYKLSEKGYKHKPHQILVATQIQSRTADNATDTNRDLALNGPCEEGHGLSYHGYKHKPLVATQMQSRTADNATDTNRDLALNGPCEEKYKLSKHGYKHKSHQIPVATQMQLKTADITTSTNRHVATNCPCEEKYKLSEKGYKHKPHQILVAAQIKSRTADNATDTNRDLALNGPCEEGHGLSHHGYKHKLPVATQMQQRTADNVTSTENLGGVTQSTPKKRILHECIPSTSDKDVFLLEQTMSPKKAVIRTDATTSWEKMAPETHRDFFKTATGCDLGGSIEGSRKLNDSCFYKGTPTIAYSALKGEIDTECPKQAVSKEIVDCGFGTKLKPIETATEFPFEQQAEKNIFAQYPSKQHPSLESFLIGGKLEIRNVSTAQLLSTRQLQTEGLMKQFQPHENSPLLAVLSDSRYGLATQTQDSNIQSNGLQLEMTSNCVCGVTHSQNKPDKKMEQIAAYNTNTHKTNSAKEPPNKRSKLPQASSHNVQEEPKLSDCTCGTHQLNVAKKISDKKISIERSKVPKESRQYGSQTTLVIHTQELTPDSVATHPQKTRITNESPPISIKIQELPCDCKCEYISELKSKFPRHLPSAQPEISKKDKTSSNFSKSTYLPSKSTQKLSPLFRTALDYRGEAPQTNQPDKELKQMKADSKNISTHKTGSAKKPSSKQPIQAPSRTLQEQSKFGIASDCTCGTNQTTAAEKNLYNNVNGPKSSSTKETKSKFQLGISKFDKSLEYTLLRKSLPLKCRSNRYKSLPRKCRCPVECLQDSVDQQPYVSKDSSTPSKRNIVNVYMPRSKLPKSLERSRPPKSLLRQCRCPVESLHDSVSKPPYGTKLSKLASKRSIERVDKTPKSSDHTPSHEYLQQTCSCPVEGLQVHVRKQSGTNVNKTFSKRNCVKVDKTRPKFPKSSEHTPPQEYLHHGCTCPVKNLQDPVNKKTSQSSRKSVFSHKTERKSFDFSDECPCSLSKKYLNKISLPVNWNNTKRLLIRSRGSTCSVNEPSSRVQSSRISQYSSKVSSLVMSLRSKFFSRKSKQTKIPENPSKKPLPVNFSSLQVKPKIVDKRTVSTDGILESLLDDEANQSHFRRSHKSNTSQNPSFPLHSSHSSCSAKDQYISKPLIVDKSYSCLHSVVKNFQRPSFLSHSSKYECRSKSIIVDPRVSQSIISRQSKTSEHSSIVTLFTRKSHSKSQSQQKQTSKKFDPQYSSSQMNCPPTSTARQTVRSQLPPSPKPLVEKSKISSLFNRPQSKPIFEKVRSRTDKISTYSLKDKQEKKSSTPGVQTALIYPSKCASSPENTQPNILKMDSFHHSYPQKLLTVKKPFETIPQPPKSEQVIPIIPGRCTCASNNKLQPNTNLSPLGNKKKAKFSQHRTNQTLKLPTSKVSQLPSRHQTGIPHNAPLCHIQSTHTKPYKCRGFMHGNDQEVSNRLQKMVKNGRRLHEKFHKSHLISHNIVHRSEISQCPRIHPSPQIQINEQNLQDQKRLSKIPTNVDKPPPEMLQQHSPGHGRKSTAEGEVRQPYPDFNRISIRYPGHKSPPKQSLQIPGINGHPSANNYPLAPGATPTPNYASDPYFANPPKRCLPKSPYDESALRCAYKRRPLRYTPPRQQLPRVVMVKKLQQNKQRAAEAKRRKGIQQTKYFFKCFRHIINKAEREVWPTDVKCHPMWLNALKRKPCFCIYKLFPRAYPTFLNCYKTQKHIGQLLIYFITLCFWSPLLLCGYLCCNVLCKCCS